MLMGYLTSILIYLSTFNTVREWYCDAMLGKRMLLTGVWRNEKINEVERERRGLYAC